MGFTGLNDIAKLESYKTLKAHNVINVRLKPSGVETIAQHCLEISLGPALVIHKTHLDSTNKRLPRPPPIKRDNYITIKTAMVSLYTNQHPAPLWCFDSVKYDSVNYTSPICTPVSQTTAKLKVNTPNKTL